ncbi:hypothetical protein [Nonomuraea sp. NPDC003201]
MELWQLDVVGGVLPAEGREVNVVTGGTAILMVRVDELGCRS